MFTERKITAFQHKIADLPDTPTLTASELKARFDACPEQLRQALNAVCDDGKALENRIDAYRAQTFTGEITETMLDEPLADKINAKADQTDLDTETSAREAADTALQTQVAAKCEVVFGTYTGDGTENRTISLGFTPKAVLLLTAGGRTYYDRHYYGGLAYTGRPITVTISQTDYNVLKIVSNGFQVTYYYYSNTFTAAESNANGTEYVYIAFK